MFILFENALSYYIPEILLLFAIIYIIIYSLYFKTNTVKDLRDNYFLVFGILFFNFIYCTKYTYCFYNRVNIQKKDKK